MFTYLPAYGVAVEWDHDAATALTSGGNSGRLRIGDTVIPYSHPITVQSVPVANGPYTVGLAWYVVGDARYESFGEMAAAELRKHPRGTTP